MADAEGISLQDDKNQANSNVQPITHKTPSADSGNEKWASPYQRPEQDPDEAFTVVEQDGTPADITPATNKRLLQKIDFHIIPMMCLVYGLNYLDKTTLSYGSVMGLEEDLHLTKKDYQWLGSIFYFGYLGFEYPTSRLLQRLPLAKWTSVNIILWGVVLMCTAATTNYGGIATVRLILGVLEAAVTPAFVLLTSQWYTKREQGARTAIWFSFNGFANVLGGLVAYGVAKGTKTHVPSIASWKIVFLIWGALTVAVGALFLVVIPDNPLKATFLEPKDRRIAIERIRQNQQGIGNRHFKAYQFKEAFTDPQTWALCVFALLWDIPNGGISTFFSQLVVSFGYTAEQSLLYACPAGAIAAVAIVLNGYIGDRIRQRIAVSQIWLILSLIGMILIVALPLANRRGRLAGYYLSNASTATLVTMLSLISSNVAGYTKKTTVAAMFLIFYCTGNIIGPQIFNAHEAPRFRSAEITILVCWGVCVIDLAFLLFYYRYQNSKKAAIRFDSHYQKLEHSEWLDLTDRENPELIYSL